MDYNEIDIFTIPTISRDYSRTILFKTIEDRDTFFDNRPKKTIELGKYIAGTNQLIVNISFNLLKGYQYLRFNEEIEGRTRSVYAFIDDIQLLNSNTSKLTFSVDVLTTYLPGYNGFKPLNLYIERLHVDRWRSYRGCLVPTEFTKYAEDSVFDRYTTEIASIITKTGTISYRGLEDDEHGDITATMTNLIAVITSRELFNKDTTPTNTPQAFKIKGQPVGYFVYLFPSSVTYDYVTNDNNKIMTYEDFKDMQENTNISGDSILSIQPLPFFPPLTNGGNALIASTYYEGYENEFSKYKKVINLLEDASPYSFSLSGGTLPIPDMTSREDKNESKLLMYPYRFYSLVYGGGEDTQKLQDLRDNYLDCDEQTGEVKVKINSYVYYPFSPNNESGLFIVTNGYSNPFYPIIKESKGVELPFYQPQYTDYLKYTKALTDSSNMFSTAGAWTSAGSGMINTLAGVAIAGSLTGGIGAVPALVGGGIGIATNLANTAMSTAQTYKETELKEKMLQDKPPTQIGTFSGLLSLATEQNEIAVLLHEIHPRMKKVIAERFRKYGYSFNQDIRVDTDDNVLGMDFLDILDTRTNFNYIKANIDDMQVKYMTPDEFNTIKMVFSNGVTFYHWHKEEHDGRMYYIVHKDEGDNTEKTLAE